MRNYVDFSDGAFLGYLEERENIRLLDRVVAAAMNAPGKSVDLTTACYNAGVDPDSLTNSDVQYIMRKFEGR